MFTEIELLLNFHKIHCLKCNGSHGEYFSIEITRSTLVSIQHNN